MGNFFIMTSIISAVIVICAFFFIFNKPFRETTINMITTNENSKEIKDLKILKNLQLQVEKLDLTKYNKEKILKVIDFEISMVEHELFKELGKRTYEEMIKEEKK
jgi:hypothetical protein